MEPVEPNAKSIEIIVTGKNTIILKDVLVGDVWLCSGQSNMEWPLSGATNGPTEVSNANHQEIRLFRVPRNPAIAPQGNCEGKWEICSSQTALDFSAIGYFFGRELHQTFGTPVGLIGSYFGGTIVEAWMGLEGFEKQASLDNFKTLFERFKAQRLQYESDFNQKTLPAWEQEFSQWQEKHGKAYETACQEWESMKKQGIQPLPAKPQLEKALPPKPQITPIGDNPTVLYNGMIAPIAPFGMKGVIWYQGESNTREPLLYRSLFPALISDWRRRWGQGDFPFLFVQLAAFIGQPAWDFAGLREAQLMALSEPSTGMAVAIDLGEPNNIHPKNKLDVARRLGLAARRIAYGQELVYSGPIYKNMQVEGEKIRLCFEHAGGGLMIGATPFASNASSPAGALLKGFTIAGADKKFIPAHAQIENNTVLVWSEQIDRPVAVRYGWENNPDVNLYNKEQLPASPFRTDD